MFLRTALAVILQLPDDDVFGRSDHDRLTAIFHPSRIAKRPGMQLVPTGRVKIRLEACVAVNHVEVPPLLARHLSRDHISRWNVERRRGKDFWQTPDILAFKK